MKTAYPETLTFPEGRGSAPELAELIDETIKRFTKKFQLLQFLVALRFPRELEAIYEAETKQARVRELRFTQAAAVGYICVCALPCHALIPDLGWLAPKLILLGDLVYALPIFIFGRLSGRMRETILFIATVFIANVIIGIICLSRAPTAPLAIFFSFLGVMYANTTTPLRFPYAVSFSLAALVTIAIHLYFDPMINNTIGVVLMFMGVAGTSGALIANYRMERGARLGYLLASKEALRLFAVNRAREDLETISGTDALTGIANRGHFDRRLAALFDGNAALGTAVHLIMLDVDFFKRFNDRYGHPGGDACLRAIAAVLTRAVREKADFVFRYGGEEFGALLLDTSQERAEEIAERIRGSVQETAIEHLNREDGLNVVTVSVGVAHAVIGDGSTADSLIERADLALYASKHGGRNRVSLSR